MHMLNETVDGAVAPDSDQLWHNLLGGPAAVRPVAAPHELQSPEVIKAILHRECARCERSGSSFCLIVIDPGRSPAVADRLGEFLIRQVRQTDEIGYLDKQRLCVFLPYTEPAGAEQFLTRFLERAAALGLNPASKLYVYPSQKIDGIDAAPAATPAPAEDNGRKDPQGGAGQTARNGDAARNGQNRISALTQVEEPARVEELLARPSPLWKRILDIVVSVSALIVLSPLMLAIAAAIKLTSKGPVFFTQWRSGLGGKPFRIYKFRTMVPDADRIKRELLAKNEQDGPAFKMTRDPRVTSIGKLLRVTSLDELPQFLNVLIGDMSLVGPRPLPLSESDACDTWHRRRLDVVPGLTCTWQISGRGQVTFAEWVRMDRNYIKTRSLLHDMKLMALTVPAVLSRKGAK